MIKNPTRHCEPTEEAWQSPTMHIRFAYDEIINIVFCFLMVLMSSRWSVSALLPANDNKNKITLG